MNKPQFKIFIDPRCQILYASYYIIGLHRIYGSENVKFNTTLSYEGRADYDQFFAFVIIDAAKGAIKKYVVDYGDKNTVREHALQWCDTYGKINISIGTEISTPKLLSIPPSFGVRIWMGKENIFNAVLNLIKCGFKPPVPIKSFLGSYKACEYRNSIEDYEGECTVENENYVFFMSTLWDHQECIDFTNPLRYTYMKAAKNNIEIFEGGFIATESNKEYYKYSDMIISTFLNSSAYLEKVKKSIFVFNTPAVHNCHGWKLGEFLALGKAIISTPLSNMLPSPLVSGENIVIVCSENEVHNAIKKLQKVQFRNKLKRNSKKYYETYASPQAVVQMIINNIK